MGIILKVQNLNKHFYKNQKKEDAEYLKTNGKMELKKQLNILKLRAIQKIGTGEIWMELITYHGVKINIFQFTVDHAGLKELHLQLLIDSILNTGKIWQHLLHWMHKQ